MAECGTVTAGIKYDVKKNSFSATLMKDDETKKTLENAGKKCEQEVSTTAETEGKDHGTSSGPSEATEKGNKQGQPSKPLSTAAKSVAAKRKQDSAKTEVTPDMGTIEEAVELGIISGGRKGGKKSRRKRKRGGRKSKRRSGKKARKSKKSKRRRGKKSKRRRRRK
tara:strand:+ start:375 stop:872 length:498 start_codon:yes stop_codon:yes gene_type:complete